MKRSASARGRPEEARTDNSPQQGIGTLLRHYFKLARITHDVSPHHTRAQCANVLQPSGRFDLPLRKTAAAGLRQLLAPLFLCQVRVHTCGHTPCKRRRLHHRLQGARPMTAATQRSGQNLAVTKTKSFLAPNICRHSEPQELPFELCVGITIFSLYCVPQPEKITVSMLFCRAKNLSGHRPVLG